MGGTSDWRERARPAYLSNASEAASVTPGVGTPFHDVATPLASELVLHEFPLPRAVSSWAAPGVSSKEVAVRRHRKTLLQVLNEHGPSVRAPLHPDLLGGEGGGLRRVFARIAALEVSHSEKVDEGFRLRSHFSETVSSAVMGHLWRELLTMAMHYFDIWRCFTARAARLRCQGAVELMQGGDGGGRSRRAAASRVLDGLCEKRKGSDNAALSLRILCAWKGLASTSSRGRRLASGLMGLTNRSSTFNVLIAGVLRNWHRAAAESAAELRPKPAVAQSLEEAIREIEKAVAETKAKTSKTRSELVQAERHNEGMERGAHNLATLVTSCIDQCRAVGMRAGADSDRGSDVTAAPPDARQERDPLLRQRMRLLEDLKDTACALAHAVLAQDDAEELERMLRERVTLWQKMGWLRAGMQVELENAQRSRTTAEQEVERLEALVAGLLRELSEVETRVAAAADEARAEELFQALRELKAQLERLAMMERQAGSRVQRCAAQLQDEVALLQSRKEAQREAAQVEQANAMRLHQVELEAEREKQKMLMDLFNKEREKVLYLEQEHQALVEEGAVKAGQRAELGAVAKQLERLTQERFAHLERQRSPDRRLSPSQSLVPTVTVTPVSNSLAAPASRRGGVPSQGVRTAAASSVNVSRAPSIAAPSVASSNRAYLEEAGYPQSTTASPIKVLGMWPH